MRVERCFAEVRACFVAVWCMSALAGVMAAQAPLAAGDEISFERDWPAQMTPFYRVTVRGDGNGSVTTVKEPTGDPTAVTTIHVSIATRDKLFAVEPVLAGTRGCETGSKKLAQTGKKTLTLRRDGKVLTCAFNYSDDRRLVEAVNAFGGIETTMEQAPKLTHLRRYDRLGLDAEIGGFLDAVKAGRAIELGNIATELRALAGDGDLMERVRNRATDLLAMADEGK